MSDLFISKAKFLNDRKYYNPKNFIWLAPLFSFLLPGILYYINIRNTEEKNKSSKVLVLILVLSVLFFLSIFFFDNKLPEIINKNIKYVYEAINFIVGYFLYLQQKETYDQWKENRIKAKSLLLPVLISIVPIVLFVIVLASNPFTYKENIVIGNSSISYSNGITKKEASDLGSLFVKVGLLNGDSNIHLILQEKKDMYELYVPIIDKYIDSREILDLKREVERIANDSNLLKKKLVLVQVNQKYRKVGKNE